MTGLSGSGEGLIRAADIEVRVLAEEGRPPAWLSHPDEAGQWIHDITQRIVKDTLEGLVQVERRIAEPHSFLVVMTCFTSPTAKHMAILETETAALAGRIQHDLAVRFGIERTQPYVRVDADPHFAASGHASALAVVHPQIEPGPARAYPVHPTGAEEPVVNPSTQQAGRSLALIWMGALLGAAVIASLFLLGRVNELQADAAAASDLRVQNTRLTMDLALARSARSFEQAQCAASISQHREMISDLAQKCSPKQPAPKPPPAPLPYPESPDPFAPARR